MPGDGEGTRVAMTSRAKEICVDFMCDTIQMSRHMDAAVWKKVDQTMFMSVHMALMTVGFSIRDAIEEGLHGTPFARGQE